MPASFEEEFKKLTGHEPLQWQRRLYYEHISCGNIPGGLDVPTGLGKTSIIAIWYLALKAGVALPRRLVYVVDRRTVVDQATSVVEEIKSKSGDETLRVSTLRGQHVDNRDWLTDPSDPAVILGTVDMIGSRLLFSGYGVSYKMRPYHAGMLGVDALVVLDEAHLVPPFAHLLQAIERDPAFWPGDLQDRKMLPQFVVLPLSATYRDSGTGTTARQPFRLEERDSQTDRTTKRRLDARKRLQLKKFEDKDPSVQLAEMACNLAEKDGKFSRVVIFCDRRDKSEGSRGPTAQGVKEAIEKAGRAKRDLHRVELLVGARRVREREAVVSRLEQLGYIGEKTPLTKPTFLVATSAGEVGADIDADHMISDLVSWERMVQRLGRVNRRGEGDAEIIVFWGEPTIKDAKAPSESDKRSLIAYSSKAVIESLPALDDGCDASPGSLRRLTERALTDPALKNRVGAATTPEPLYPALSRALVDAWSMTSLPEHTGRPDIAPWLRGWVDEAPQTTIIWRGHLPVPTGVADRGDAANRKEIDDFFEATPPHESEKLTTETYRIAGFLQARATRLLKRNQPKPKENNESDEPEVEMQAADDDEALSAPEQEASHPYGLRSSDIAALLLSQTGHLVYRYSLDALAEDRKAKKREEFEGDLAGKLLVLDARFGGLEAGLLEADSPSIVETADCTEEWNKDVRFRVRHEISSSDEKCPPVRTDSEWRFEHGFALRRHPEGGVSDWLIVEHLRDGAATEEARSISKFQERDDHQASARRRIGEIAAALNQAGATKALSIAAGLHDEGKRAPSWQKGFNAPSVRGDDGRPRIFAKTPGPIDRQILNGYRHEFGSLPFIQNDSEFNELPGDLQDLVLHLVAAHHGRARPLIETRGCDDLPPSLLEERACAVSLRFARLQKRWGAWGLAWWESLLRAADQQASRDNELKQACSAKGNFR